MGLHGLGICSNLALKFPMFTWTWTYKESNLMGLKGFAQDDGYKVK